MVELQTIFREIMSACRSLEKKVIVAYLGPEGTFSEQAVYQHFGKSINAIPCASIDEVFRAAEAGTADFGVVPIENSTEGAISRTLDLLMQTPLTISSEVSIPIHHNLMTLSGNMDGVRSICAHSQALAQCQGWFEPALSQYHETGSRLQMQKRPVLPVKIPLWRRLQEKSPRWNIMACRW